MQAQNVITKRFEPKHSMRQSYGLQQVNREIYTCILQVAVIVNKFLIGKNSKWRTTNFKIHQN